MPTRKSSLQVGLTALRIASNFSLIFASPANPSVSKTAALSCHRGKFIRPMRSRALHCEPYTRRGPSHSRVWYLNFIAATPGRALLTLARPKQSMIKLMEVCLNASCRGAERVRADRTLSQCGSTQTEQITHNNQAIS